EFITIIEELGWIGLIDHYVLEKTVQDLAADPAVRLGLNISGMTACDRSWLRSLISLLRHRRDIARRLVVEITETAALGDIAQSVRFVDTLRHAGCRVALDDFGAGHTSLRHLQILPVDIVKIDGSLVRNLTNRPETRIFFRHLLGLIKDLGSDTVAEGVESAEDAALRGAEGYGLPPGSPFRAANDRARVAPEGRAHVLLNDGATRRRWGGIPRPGSLVPSPGGGRFAPARAAIGCAGRWLSARRAE